METAFFGLELNEDMQKIREFSEFCMNYYMGVLQTHSKSAYRIKQKKGVIHKLMNNPFANLHLVREKKNMVFIYLAILLM